MSLGIAITRVGLQVAGAASLEQLEQLWRSGTPAAKRPTVFDPSGFDCQLACELDASSWAAPAQARVLAFVERALQQICEGPDRAWLETRAERTGLLVGTTSGASASKERLAALRLGRTAPPAPAELQSLYAESGLESLYRSWMQTHGLGGPGAACSVACTSGGHALAMAALLLKAQEAEAMLVSAVEAISLTAYAGFCSVRAMTSQASRPFHAERDGMWMGEGSAAYLLERAEDARSRGASILGELLGFGCSNDAYHSVSPHPKGEGLADSIRNALQMARLEPEQVGLICAHATGTVQNDAMEREAYRAVFGERLAEIPVIVAKPLLGHTLGAAGGVEVAFALQALTTGQLHPLRHQHMPEPNCPMRLVTGGSLPHSAQVALVCNAAFGGNNTALILRGPQHPTPSAELAPSAELTVTAARETSPSSTETSALVQHSSGRTS